MKSGEEERRKWELTGVVPACLCQDSRTKAKVQWKGQSVQTDSLAPGAIVNHETLALTVPPPSSIEYRTHSTSPVYADSQVQIASADHKIPNPTAHPPTLIFASRIPFTTSSQKPQPASTPTIHVSSQTSSQYWNVDSDDESETDSPIMDWANDASSIPLPPPMFTPRDFSDLRSSNKPHPFSSLHRRRKRHGSSPPTKPGSSCTSRFNLHTKVKSEGSWVFIPCGLKSVILRGDADVARFERGTWSRAKPTPIRSVA